MIIDVTFEESSSELPVDFGVFQLLSEIGALDRNGEITLYAKKAAADDDSGNVIIN